MIPLVCIVLLIIATLLSYQIGFNNGLKDSDPTKIFGTTFYAEIEEINDNKVILVKGLDVNDINFRSKFTFTVEENTILEWRHTKIYFNDLKVGQRISITFTGVILESYPAVIKGVGKIVLLDDEV